jgi:hypothetical protein
MGGSSSGALRGAFIAGATAFAFQQIGDYFEGISGVSPNATNNFGGNLLTGGQVAQQIAAHAIVGGIAADLQGGKFGHGFFAAGVTKGIGGKFLPSGNNLTGNEIAQGTVVSAIIGGTASVISGGKFANGARTAAMQYLFNQASQKLQKWSYENQQKNGTLRMGIDGHSGLRSNEINALKRLFSPSGAFVFAAHGNDKGIYLNGITQMYAGASSFEDVVATIVGSGYSGEHPLFMLSCDIANNGLAQMLSNHFNQTVIGASSGQIWINGSSSSGYSYSPKDNSAFITEFNPDD